MSEDADYVPKPGWLQRQSDNVNNSDYLPRSITGECSHCHHVFDQTRGMVCPKCLRTGLLWACNEPLRGNVSSTLRFHMEAAHARMAQDSWDEVHAMRRKMYNYGLTEGDLKDVAELDRMFALRDNRD